MVDKKLINEKEVRFTEELDGQKTSRVVTLKEAKTLAEEKGLDLICISDKGNPKVVIIEDLGKYNYRLQKAKKEAIKKQKEQIQPLKEVYITDFTEENDIDTKIKQIVKFIDKENALVKIGIRYRGRERKNMQYGEEKLNNIIDKVNNITNIKIHKGLEKTDNKISITIKKDK